jgi:ubiquinone/menaquinone biosynthesis C-methylase UbiE
LLSLTETDFLNQKTKNSLKRRQFIDSKINRYPRTITHLASSNTQDFHKQKLVDDFFDTHSMYWRNTYREKDIFGAIYQRRQATALNYIDGLFLPKNAHVLEIGCGAGFLTASLAKRGFVVEAIDHAQAMVDLTKEHIKQKGIVNRITVCTGDIHDLSYEGQTFDLTIALGVVPWLHDYKKALTEIVRVSKSGGYVVLTMDNALRATTLFDPKTSPPVAKIRWLLKSRLKRTGLLTSRITLSNEISYSQHSPKQFNRSLCEAGLTILKSTSVGFGPFTFFSHNVFSDSLGIKINNGLQKYADCGYPVLRSIGSMYIVLATKKQAF